MKSNSKQKKQNKFEISLEEEKEDSKFYPEYIIILKSVGSRK